MRGLAQRLRQALLAIVVAGVLFPAAAAAVEEETLPPEAVPAAPNTWYTRGAFAALRAAADKRDLQAVGAAAVNSGLADAIARLSGLGPDWLRRSKIAVRLSDDLSPTYDASTVQPLYRSRSGLEAVFVEGRLILEAAGDRRTTTGNARIGYRRLLHGDRILLGVTGFYDHARGNQHRRLGVGAEIRSRPLTLTGTYYGDLPEEGSGKAAAKATDRVLDGFDLKLDAQLPYLPWARVYGEMYWRQVNTLGDTTEGERFGLRLNPLPPLRLEFGSTRRGEAEPVYHARLSYARTLGRPPERTGPLIDRDALAFGDPGAYSLDRFGD